MRAITVLSLLLPLSAIAGETKLFNGKDLTGWTNAEGKPVTEGWKVEDGVLHRESKNGGDIITEKEYGDFELTWDWKIVSGGNSGLKYLVHFIPNKGPLGFEYQLLDDEKHPDGKLPTHRTAALYDIIAPASDKKVNPPGEWNTSRLIIRGTHVEHWLNGQKVVDTDMSGEAFKAAFAKSKYKGIPNFGEGPKGHILLQDHGDGVWFRNITIVTPDT